MKTYKSIIVGLGMLIGCSQVASAAWTDDFNSYANDAAIQAVYGAGGAFSSPYGTDPSTAPLYKWASNTALGINNSNGKYALRALDRPEGLPTVSVEAMILPYTWATPDTTASATFRLAHDTDWNDWHADVRAIDGKFQVYDFDTYVDLDLDGDGIVETGVDGDDLLAEDTYYKVRIVATHDTINGGTYDVYLNDVLVYEDASFRAGFTAQDSTYVRFARGGTAGATMAVDDVVVTSGLSIGTMVIIE